MATASGESNVGSVDRGSTGAGTQPLADPGPCRCLGDCRVVRAPWL
jgi:hypothetical protein